MRFIPPKVLRKFPLPKVHPQPEASLHHHTHTTMLQSTQAGVCNCPQATVHSSTCSELQVRIWCKVEDQRVRNKSPGEIRTHAIVIYIFKNNKLFETYLHICLIFLTAISSITIIRGPGITYELYKYNTLIPSYLGSYKKESSSTKRVTFSLPG